MNFHQRSPLIVNHGTGYTAMLPSAVNIGKPLSNSWNYLSQWQRQGGLFYYTGPPDIDISLNYDDPDYTSKYYFLTNPPDRKEGGARRYACIITYWRWYPRGLISQIRLYPEFTSPTVVPLWQSYLAGSEPVDVDYGDAVHPGLDTLKLEFELTPNSGDIVCSILEIENLLPASILIYELPSFPLNTEQLQTRQLDVATGKIIRGHNSVDSLGGLMHRIGGDVSENLETIERMTRRNLIAWGHGVGVFGADRVDDENLFNEATYKIQTRAIIGDGLECHPCFIVQCDTGATIKYTSLETGDVWTWVAGADYHTPTLITSADGTGVAYGAGGGLKCAHSDEIQIDHTGDDKLVHSVYLLEGNAFTEAWFETAEIFSYGSVHVPAYAYNSSSGTVTAVVSTDSYFPTYQRQGGDGNEIRYKLYLEAGTWAFAWMAVRASPGGIQKVYASGTVSGASQIGEYDLYNSSTQWNQYREADSTYVVVSPEIIDIIFKVDGKHASASSDYRQYLISFGMWRVL